MKIHSFDCRLRATSSWRADGGHRQLSLDMFGIFGRTVVKYSTGYQTYPTNRRSRNSLSLSIVIFVKEVMLYASMCLLVSGSSQNVVDRFS